MLVDAAVGNWNPDDFNAWWDLLQTNSSIDAKSRALMLYSLFESLGRPVGPEKWASLVGVASSISADIPDAALRYSLRHASESNRVGETVLMSLLTIGDKAMAGANPLMISTVVAALRRVGLDAEARVLALEAAIGAGL
jgi:hypothetical protein